MSFISEAAKAQGKYLRKDIEANGLLPGGSSPKSVKIPL